MVIGFWANYFIHKGLAWYREKHYLATRAIGVDIDGVLTLHVQHFCTLLSAKTSKKIEPRQIVHIPVHTCPGLNVSQRDETDVFNDGSYWTQMPVDPDAQRGMKSVARFFASSQIRIYSHRLWLNYQHLAKDEAAACKKTWERPLCFLTRPMERITKKWLASNGFTYQYLRVEDDADPARNRFTDAERGLLRIFIEDDLVNARRLAASCHTVVLRIGCTTSAPAPNYQRTSSGPSHGNRSWST
jgi:uncharacterized HAD superfamily protein